MSEQIEVSTDLPATAQEVFTAWLDSQAHSQFTGSTAVIDPAAGGSFTAWDGYIWGTTLEIEQNYAYFASLANRRFSGSQSRFAPGDPLFRSARWNAA